MYKFTFKRLCHNIGYYYTPYNMTESEGLFTKEFQTIEDAVRFLTRSHMRRICIVDNNLTKQEQHVFARKYFSTDAKRYRQKLNKNA